jgi:hypothetical protein
MLSTVVVSIHDNLAGQANSIKSFPGNSRINTIETTILQERDGQGDSIRLLSALRNNPNGIAGLADELANLGINVTKEQIDAFMKANYIKQREKTNPNYPDKDNDYNQLRTFNIGSDIEIPSETAKVGGTKDTPITSVAHGYAVALTDSLIGSLGETNTTGLAALQQLEDWSEFEAWVEDIKATRSLYPHENADRAREKAGILYSSVKPQRQAWAADEKMV